MATPKQTGGVGYTFEDNVVARWFLHLLEGTSPLSDGGRIEHLSLQARPDGWLLDDVVATIRLASGEKQEVAASIKSNNQIRKDGSAPIRFIADCWRQLLNEKFAEVSRQTVLALVQRDMGVEHRAAIDNVLNYARSQDPDKLDRRINTAGWANDVNRAFYQSFQCPDDIWDELGSEKNQPSPGVILQHVAIIDYDFLNSTSQAQTHSVSICRAQVKSPDHAEILWNRLQAIARKEAGNAADIDRNCLLRHLRGEVSLSEHPWLIEDWNALFEHSARFRERVSTTLEGHRFERVVQRKQLSEYVEDHQCVAIVGPPGAGKSGLVKLADSSLGERVVWLDATEIERITASIDVSLGKLLTTAPEQRACLVVENIEGLGLPEITRLLDVLGKVAQCANWRIILTCTELRWGQMSDFMEGDSSLSKPQTLITRGFSDAELDEVANELPSLRQVMEKTSLREIVRRPQALEFLLHKQEKELDDLAGEGTLAAWYWEKVVNNSLRGSAAGNMVKRLAEAQAGSHRESTPLSELPDAFQSSDTTNELNKRGIAYVTDLDQVRFAHGWVRDIALARLLGEKLNDQFAEFVISRVGNPYWHNAVRILSALLLETDGRQWKEAVETLLAKSDGAPVVALMLDAFLRAPNTSELLERHAGLLTADESELLQRLLVSVEAQISSFPRKNIRRATDEIVQWMSSKSDKAVFEDSFSEWNSLFWCSMNPDALSAQTVGTLSQKVIEFAREPERLRWSKRGSLYQSLCLAHCHEPEAASDIIKDLTGLNESTAAARRTSSPLDPPDAELPSRWPHGPFGPPASGFAKAVLEGGFEGHSFSKQEFGPLSLLLSHDQELFSNVLLALCIEPPTHHWYSPGAGIGIQDLSVVHENLWRPSDPQNLFRLLLEADPEVGLQTILNLVDFATERWHQVRWENNRTIGQLRPFDVGSIQLLCEDDAKRTYLGGRQLVHWHIGAFQCPAAVSTALMALEHWLYGDIARALDYAPRLLKESKSVAVVGVLMSVARHAPNLLDDALSPLLTSPYLLLWSRYLEQDLKWRSLPGTSSITEGRWKRLHEWHSKEHRKKRFEDIVEERWFEHELDWAPVGVAREVWISQLESQPAEAQEVITGLIKFFTPANWVRTEEANGYVPSDEFAAWLEMKAEQRRPELKVAQKTQQRLLIPVRCSGYLEDEAAAREVDPTELWDLLNNSNTDVGNTYEVRIAVAAVLLCTKREWLLDHDAARKRVTTVLTDAIKELKADLTHGRRQVGSWCWTRFAGESSVVLWKLYGLRRSGILASIKSKLGWEDSQLLVRESDVATAIAGATDTDAKLVFRRINQEYDCSGSEMQRALTIALRFSRLLWLNGWLSGHETEPDAILTAVNSLLDKLPEAGELPAPQEWGKIVTWIPNQVNVSGFRRPRGWYDGVNAEYLFNCFDWLLDTSLETPATAVSSKEECEFLVGLWAILLACESGRFARRDNRHFSQRTRGAHRLQNRLANTIACTSCTIRYGDQLFQRVIELTFAEPRPVGGLVEALGDGLARYGFDSPEIQRKRMQQVLECVLEHPKPEYFERFSDTRAACLGLGKLQSYTWQRMSVESGSGLRTLLEEFHQHVFTDVRTVERLLSFLSTSPGKPLQSQAISWLASAEKDHWNRDRFVVLVADLILSTWQDDATAAQEVLRWVMDVRPRLGKRLAMMLGSGY